MLAPHLSATLRAVIAAATLLSALGSDALAARTVERIAGIGVCGMGAPGNGGPALDACLGLPAGVAVDGSGAVYVAEVLRGAIRRIDASTGTITQLPVAALALPGAIALDGAGGLFVATAGDGKVHRIDLSTNATTHVAGNGSTSHCGDGGQATSACIGTPFALAVHDGTLYLADPTNHRVRAVDLATGVISTIAGDGTNLEDGTCPEPGEGLGADPACLSMPAGVAVDSSGNVYVADNGNHRIERVLAATGDVEVYAGTGIALPCDEDLPAEDACIPYPGLLAIDANDALYVSEAVVLPPGFGGPASPPTPFPNTALLVRITSGSAPAERLTGTLPCSDDPEGLPADGDCTVLGFGLAVSSSGERIVYSAGLANVVRTIVEVPGALLPAAFRSGLVPPTTEVSDTERRADGIVRTEANDLSKCFVSGVAGFLGGKHIGCDAVLSPCTSDASCPSGQSCSTGPIGGLCECSANSECAPGYTCDRRTQVYPVPLCTEGCSVAYCVASAGSKALASFDRSGAPACARNAVGNGPFLATQRNIALWCDGTEPLPPEFTNGHPGGFFPASKTAGRATLRVAKFLAKLTGDLRKCFERGVGAVVAGLPHGVTSCRTRAAEKFYDRAQKVAGLPACVDLAELQTMVFEQEGDRNGMLYCAE